jgi:hypothetical protein
LPLADLLSHDMILGSTRVQGDEEMSPDNRLRLAEIHRIVHELAMDPEVPVDHPLVTAAVQLAYLVGYFPAKPEEN